MEALTVAIQAVELLGKIKAEMYGQCAVCKNSKPRRSYQSCYDCVPGETYPAKERPHWEFRWSLGKDAAT